MTKTFFSEEHEWITVNGSTGTVGITAYAQDQLGDIVFVEVTKLNESVSKNDDVAVVESVKAASDIFAPVSGTIVASNEVLDAMPELLNSDPTNEGWIFKITIENTDELESLMDNAMYNKFVDSLK